MSDSETNALKSQIQEHLISSGNYDRLSKALATKLYETGWVDSMKQAATAKASTMDKPNFDELNESLQQKGMDLVNDTVKRDMMALIKEYLDGVISS
ncbi:hypothetical protein BABINDRAFT_162365 [Babjeviella inositovora NRRL Y-12698]|uniref:Transcription and mRNA export factor SUS1 n=1 Tax=Babjeviella inositovora NRRL Y-12698 TaxID=984486 RepID=A0A1E3QLX9_9ASCO|nr:uncharacterized protein BABINDRAFT_162365 [Babjeviella inositovora NRRL Y-12698]ODQ78660.1 hypothetical protein BABINDRAFT_162365 [Babjeviella inositovora NRRL Y-12698]